MSNVALSATSLAITRGAGGIVALPNNLLALQTLWATLPNSLITLDKLRNINSMMVPGSAVDVPRDSVSGILNVASASVRQYATSGANPQARLACNYMLALIEYESFSTTIQTSSPEVQALIQNLTPNLLADPATGVTQVIIDQMLALINPPIPWWQANGFPHAVDVLYLIDAGNLF